MKVEQKNTKKVNKSKTRALADFQEASKKFVDSIET